MPEKLSIQQVLCPFGERCHFCRQEAARVVLRRKVVFSDELKRELKEGELGCGEGAARKALSFLHNVQRDKNGTATDVFGCSRHIEALRKVEERRTPSRSNVLYFDGRNKLFFIKPARTKIIRSKIRMQLTNVQLWLLSALQSRIFDTYYLSSFEARKLSPYPSEHVSNSLDRLLDLGFLREVTVDVSNIHKRLQKVVDIRQIVNGLRNGSLKKRLEPDSQYWLGFITTEESRKPLENLRQSAITEELTEYEVAKQVHMRILQKYKSLVSHYGMRSKDPDLSKATRGYSFDIFYVFRNGRKLGVDVYCRLPLSEAIVRVFAKKIRASGGLGHIYTRNRPNREVNLLCRESGIEITCLEDTSIDYAKIRQEVETRVMKAGNLN